MNQSDTEDKSMNSDELSIKDLILKLKSSVAYFKTKWLIILLMSSLGGALGFTYAFISKPLYAAKCTFVLEEGGKTGGLGQYAGLASLAGIDVNGGGGSVFQGDNILELYKSRLMIEKALVSYGTFNGKRQLLIDRYIESYKLREQWKEDKKIGDVQFSDDPTKFGRKQDSIISAITDIFNLKSLSVVRPDKKITIIDVNFTSQDELFSKEFVNALVKNVNDFYVQTKIKKTAANVKILQHQADSVRAVLNSSISGVASAIDAAPNANPSLLTLRVPSQRKQVDVQASTAIYGEVVKNLEVSKITLRQETPLIQVIDAPVLPLVKTKVGKLKGIVLGGFVMALLTIAWLSVKKIYKSVMS